MHRFFMIIALLAAFSCATPDARTPDREADKPAEKPYTLAKPKAEWVEKRSADSEKRLNSTEAGKLVLAAINYHGGLEKWFSNGPVYFRFNYQPKPGTGVARDTYETADYWSSKTRHQRIENPSTEYGWDGNVAWKKPADAEIPYNYRFWALTPYYFAGMPFVFADSGVKLDKLENITYDDTDFNIVKATFGEGVGDAPDDYYILYIHPESSRLTAIRYVVSYPGYFNKGEHTQEKFMTYEGEQNIDGIVFPEKHRTFMWEENGTIGKYVTDITLSDIQFRPDTDQSYFEVPEGSELMRDLK